MLHHHHGIEGQQHFNCCGYRSFAKLNYQRGATPGARLQGCSPVFKGQIPQDLVFVLLMEKITIQAIYGVPDANNFVKSS